MNWQRSGRPPALVARPAAASLDEAHLAIEQWEHYSRKRLDSEQRLAVELMMAETSDGRWAADTTGRAESRQNGKGDEIEVSELWGLTQRGEAILHTAHEAATAAAAHGRLVALIEGHRDLSRLIRKKQSWNGNYSLRLTNGAVIVWRTRTGAGGRGLDDISRIVIDEAQHAQPEELASSLPVLSVNPNPQKNFIGSAGVAGKSGFWWRQRRRALSPVPGRFSWLEHSAETISLDPDGRVSASLVGEVSDPEVWRLANPAFPARISHDFLLDQLETLGAELFAREHLCVWDPPPEDTDRVDWVLPAEQWMAGTDDRSTVGDPARFGLAVSQDRLWAAFGAAGPSVTVGGGRDLGGVQVELVEYQAGTGWVIDFAARLVPAGQRLAVAKGSPAASMVSGLEAAGVAVELVPVEEQAKFCGLLFDAVSAGQVRHRDQQALTVAVRGAVKRDVGEAYVWSQRKSEVDIAPLVAVTLAAGMHIGGAVDLSVPDVIQL